MKPKKESIIILTFIILSIVVIILIRIPITGSGKSISEEIVEDYDQPMSWNPPLTHHQISSSSHYFDRLWSRSSMFVLGYKFNNNFIAHDEKIWFIGSVTERSDPFLFGIKLQDGELNWRSSRMINSTTLAYDKQKIFVNSGIYSDEINKFDISSGQLVWNKTQPQVTLGIDSMWAKNDKIVVNNGTLETTVLDSRSGDLLQEQFPPDLSPIYDFEDNIVYHEGLFNNLIATNINSNVELWNVKFDAPISQPPIFSNNLIFVSPGEAIPKEIFAIDKLSGNIIWQSRDDVVSNISITEELVFYLTIDSHLKALDKSTGKEIDGLEFSPSLRDLELIDLINRSFYVTTSDRSLAVYFGSSNQIFAFDISGFFEN